MRQFGTSVIVPQAELNPLHVFPNDASMLCIPLDELTSELCAWLSASEQNKPAAEQT